MSERRKREIPIAEKIDRRVGERREDKRIALEIWVEEQPDDNSIYFLRATNLSQGGIFFDQTIPHPIGTIITIKFNLPGNRDAIIAKGEIVNIPGKEKLGMGVNFTEIGEAEMELVRQYIRTSDYKD